MNKPILSLDFDGVIHSYTSGWKGVDIIPDPIVSGAIEFIKSASIFFSVAIYSSRCMSPNGMIAIEKYLEAHGLDRKYYIVVKDKPPAFVLIDDRALTFNGTWPDIEKLRNFKPWYKK